MGGLRPIGSEKLEGMDKIRRIMEIAKYNENIPNPVNENRNTEYTVKLADGNVYAIVREKLGYIIKSAVNENVTDYIEPIRERKYYRSYSEALKRLNLMTKELNTLYGNKKGVSLFEQDEKKKDKQYFLKTGNNQPKQETTPTPATPAPATPAPATPDMTAVAPATGATATAAPTTGGELGEQAVDPLAAPTTPAAPAADPLAAPVDPTAAPAADPLAAPADPLADPTAVPTDVPDTEMSMDTEEPEDDTEGGKGKKEEVTFKTIQKLTGRLSQKIRKYTEEEEMTSDDTKYIINSILSSLDLEALDDEDVDEIIDRLEGEEVEDEEGINPEDMMGDEMGTETGETPEPGLEGAPVAPEENTTTPPQPELEEGYDNISDAFTGKFKGAFTAGVADQMAEELDDYPRHGVAGKRHKHLEHGTFGESKVDKIISSYFKIDENEILIKEEENRKKIQKNFNLTSKKIKNLSENISQERASLKFIEKYPTSNLLGKSKTGNLIFENKNKSYRISPIGKLL